MTRAELIQELHCIKCGGSFKLSKSSFEQYQPSEMICEKCGNRMEPETYLLIQEYCLSNQKLLLEKIGKPLREVKKGLQYLYQRAGVIGTRTTEEHLDEALAIIEKETKEILEYPEVKIQPVKQWSGEN